MTEREPSQEELRKKLHEARAELERRLSEHKNSSAAERQAGRPIRPAGQDSALVRAYVEYIMRKDLAEDLDPEEQSASAPGLRTQSQSDSLNRTPTYYSDDSQSNQTEWPRGEGGDEGARWLGGYELLGILGRGGMGVVYKARQPGLNRVVALKMIRGGPHASPDAASRFRREVEAVARLHHPNILEVYEVGEVNGDPYLAMELISGGGLDAALKKAPLSARVAAGLLEILARATDHAHRRGVVHRDLKPANILLQPSPSAEQTLLLAPGKQTANVASDLTQCTPKIADFGLAKLSSEGDDPTLSGAVMGTPSYMAPEQARGGAKHAGPEADVWSLGAIFYECLTGRPPFQAETALDTLWMIDALDPVPPSTLNPRVPADLETICLKCLEKNPTRRYATAQAMADDLGRYLRDEPILARPPSAADQILKFSRRHRVLLTATAAVFLTLVLGLVGTGVGLIRAQHERDNAQQANREARALLTESYAKAAQLALQRGAWRSALVNLDKAIEAGHPDSAQLSLQKVRAWSGVHEIEKAVEQLDLLAQRTDLGPIEGSVLLWRADIGLGQSGDDDAALELVRKALKFGLPPPEEEYARALLAESSPAAVDHFRRALAADPFHQRANSMLGLTLLSLGRVPEARERLTFARMLFPEDPTFIIMLALARAWEGDMPAAQAELEGAKGQLGEKQILAAQKMLDLMQRFRAMEEIFNGDPSRAPLQIVTRFLPAVGRLVEETRALQDSEDGARPGLLLPIPPVLTKAFRQPAADVPKAMFGSSARAIEALDQSFQYHPDALLAFTRGLLLFNAERLPEAERAFLEAAGASSIIPVQRASLFVAVHCEWERAREDAAVRREFTERAVQNARKLVELGPPQPWQAALIVALALDADDLNLARRVLAEWERQAPDDLLLLRKRLAFELKAEAYGPAIAAADKYLARQPGDATVKRDRSEAVDKLRKLADSFPR